MSFSDLTAILEEDLEEVVEDTVRVSSRTSSDGSSPDSRRSLEESRSARQKQRNGIRNTNENNVRYGRGIKSGGQQHSNGPPSAAAAIEVSDALWEVTALRKEIDALKAELNRARTTIVTMQDREVKLKDRLAEQAQKMLERGVRFENVSLGDRRPTSLVRRYGSLYAQSRVDTLDALDALSQLREADELKSKLLFSVVVLAFRSVQTTLSDIKNHIRYALQVPETPDRESAASDLESGIDIYLRSTMDTFDLSRNINEVCSQIWATLYDYPCLKNCDGLLNYVRDSVRLAWCLTNQKPPYVIEYETRTFRRDMHVRFHTSGVDSDVIKTYLWPSLLEGDGGPCVHKGVVVT